MKAVILAGGRGTRLSPLTCEMPKPLVRVLDKPVLAHILALLSHHGIKEAVLTVSYLAERIRESFGEEFGGVRLRYCYEESPLGTAGGVKAAANMLNEDGEESFLVISGDAMCDFDLTGAIAVHRETNAEATLLLKECDSPLQYGVVNCREDGRILGFVEKPEWSQVCSDRVNTGIYLLKKTLLERIPSHTKYDFSAHLFPRLLRENARLFGLLCEGYWRDIGSCASYFACNRDALYNRIRLSLPLDGTVFNGRLGKWYCSFGASVDEDAAIGDGAVIGRGCRVEAGASLSSCVLCDECTVEKNAVVKEAILSQRVAVGKNAVVTGRSVVGAQSRIDDNALCVGLTLPPRSRLSGQTGFSESGRESIVCENSRFVFSSDADDGVFLRFGEAVASVCSSSVILSGSEKQTALLRMGLKKGALPLFLSDGENACQSAYAAAVASSYALHLFREKGRLSALLFAPDGFAVSRNIRKRVMAAFHSGLAQREDRTEPAAEKELKIKELYLAALFSALPQTLPPLSLEGSACTALREALERRGMSAKAPEVYLRLEEGEPLQGSFSSGGCFDRNRLLALFCQNRSAESLILSPPVPEGVLTRYPRISLLTDDRCEEKSPRLLSLLEFHDPCFTAARLLALCAERGWERVRCSLEKIPSVRIEERFYPHDRGQGAFTESICRLFKNSDGEGLVLRRPQGTVRILPSGFGGYRVIAEALKSEAAEELCAYAAEKIPTVRK